MVVFLKCSANNFATTVLQEFEKAVQLYGLPEKVRTDQGGENVDVWRAMEVVHGSSSAVISGSSTHNEQIERLWNDVWRSVVQEYEQKYEVSGSIFIYHGHYIYIMIIIYK